MTFYSFKKKILKRLLRIAPTSSLRIKILRASGYIIGIDGGIGDDFYISDRSIDKGNVIIGDRFDIAQGVRIITTSSPKFSILSSIYEVQYKKVIIKDDVWLGTGVIILPGIKIGKCSIVAAGTVVTKDVQEYSVASGNPLTIKKMNKYLIKRIKGVYK